MIINFQKFDTRIDYEKIYNLTWYTGIREDFWTSSMMVVFQYFDCWFYFSARFGDQCGIYNQRNLFISSILNKPLWSLNFNIQTNDIL